MWTTGCSFSPCTGAFAEGFGFITLITLLPYYINALDPSATTVLGVTVGAGFIIGMYASSFGLRELVCRPGSGIAPLLSGSRRP